MDGENAVNFDYEQAFSRTLGWVTDREQLLLRGKRVAIAGLGGAGGSHLLTLARLGIGAFHIADLDSFELVNMNRQAGACMETLGREKASVMAGRALAINPDLDLRSFSSGVTEENVDAFLEGADLYVDGLDYFALDIRRVVFRRCRELGIPAVTAAPLGMGAAYLIFTPDGMSFEDYFGFEGLPRERWAARFAVGLAPAGAAHTYLVDRSRIDLAGERGPSTPMAIQLCAGVVGAEALKLLLGRGRVRPAPWFHHFDAYLGRWVSSRRGFFHRIKAWAVERFLQRLGRRPESDLRALPEPSERSEMERILDRARWAPSGDNGQGWRLEILAHDRLRVRLPDSAHGVYDLRGRASLLSGGALLESIRLAATRYGRTLSWEYAGRAGGEHVLDVRLPWTSQPEDALRNALCVRATDRRPYRTTPLTSAQKEALQEALGAELEVRWRESLGERWSVAMLNARGTNLRMRLPEAIEVHQREIDWSRRYTQQGLPGPSIGLDPVLRGFSAWLLRSDRRVRLSQKLPGTSLAAQVELDLLPGVLCGAHFSIHRREAGAPGALSMLQAGQRVQRFWLVATQLGLVLQPGMTPQIFSGYVQGGVAFSEDPSSQRRARALAACFLRSYGDPASVVFMGRIGVPRSPLCSRALRLPLDALIVRRSREHSREALVPQEAAL